MRILKLLVISGLVAAAGGGASALTLSEAGEPAEFPPASYGGAQYVDSRGCVYVRAGYGEAVTWVPRVTRNRDVVCGQRPTFAKAAPVPAPAPTVAQTADIPPVKPAPPKRVVVKRPVKSVPVPKLAPARQPAPAPATAGLKRHSATCPDFDGISAYYIGNDEGLPVRCGPQSENPRGTPVAQAGTAGTAYRPAPIPEGYKAAWDDGRLNPKRGQGTAAGQAAMDTVWTQTLPRRLVATPAAKSAGKVVVVRRTTVSTKGTVPAKPARAATAAGRYVQVGSFGVPENAARTARRLQAMGLPVRVAKLARGGKPLQVVMAGPFASDGQAGAALTAARKAGFRDAFLRK